MEPVIARVVEEHLGRDVAGALTETDEAIGVALDALHAKLSGFDPTLADALSNGRRKIEHQLDGLRTRFHRAQMARDEAILRQLERASVALYPDKSLQERHLGAASFLARHGRYFLDWASSAIEPGTTDHLVVYL